MNDRLNFFNSHFYLQPHTGCLIAKVSEVNLDLFSLVLYTISIGQAFVIECSDSGLKWYFLHFQDNLMMAIAQKCVYPVMN